jgi:hypothetical protein
MGKLNGSLESRVCYTIKDTPSGEKTVIAVKNNYSWYIHSSITPTIQGRRFAEFNYNAADNILIYGLGLGYHIKEILGRMKENQHLYVLETDQDLYACFLKHGTKEILDDSRLTLKITDKLEEASLYLGTIPPDTEILYYEPLIKTLTEKFEYMKTWFNNYRLDMNASHSFKEMQENHMINRNLGLPNFLELFEEKYQGVPCVIVSSGPTLLEAGEYIKRLKGKAIIISVGRNVSFFEALGMEPTFYLEIDHQELVAKRYEKVNVNCPLVFLSSANKNINNTFAGPKAIVYVRQKATDINVLEGGGSTVAASALELALKLGFGPIGLIGQDLVFEDEKSHFDNDIKTIITPSMSRVLCNDGVLRYTNKGFLRHKESLNNVIRLLSGDNKVFNLTYKGIQIESIPYLYQEEFWKRCSSSVLKIENEIQNLHNSGRV